MEEELVKNGLQKVPRFMGKIIQMFDIFNIRFGGTLVGPTGAGKSTCYRMLAAIMSNLRNKGSKSELYQVRECLARGGCVRSGNACWSLTPLPHLSTARALRDPEPQVHHHG
jgi:ABC-type multidrug transport system ATPase subunit